jgi:hypothetical protein
MVMGKIAVVQFAALASLIPIHAQAQAVTPRQPTKAEWNTILSDARSNLPKARNISILRLEFNSDPNGETFCGIVRYNLGGNIFERPFTGLQIIPAIAEIPASDEKAAITYEICQGLGYLR